MTNNHNHYGYIAGGERKRRTEGENKRERKQIVHDKT